MVQGVDDLGVVVEVWLHGRPEAALDGIEALPLRPSSPGSASSRRCGPQGDRSAVTARAYSAPAARAQRPLVGLGFLVWVGVDARHPAPLDDLRAVPPLTARAPGRRMMTASDNRAPPGQASAAAGVRRRERGPAWGGFGRGERSPHPARPRRRPSASRVSPSSASSSAITPSSSVIGSSGWSCPRLHPPAGRRRRSARPGRGPRCRRRARRAS